jgi:hypothetical protein
MYLKYRYELKRVTDGAARKIFTLMTRIEESYYDLIINRHEEVMTITGGNNIVTIRNTGLIYFNNEERYSNTGRDIYLPELLKALQVLLDSQWVDPKEELPPEGMKVILKLRKNPKLHCGCLISQSIFQSGQFRFEQYDYVVGWLPAENVVL